MNEIDIIVEADGTVSFIHDDDLTAAFTREHTQIRRASHVEPGADGQWYADLGPVNGPVLGPYTRRAQALRAEVRWLKRHMTKQRLEVR